MLKTVGTIKDSLSLSLSLSISRTHTHTPHTHAHAHTHRQREREKLYSYKPAKVLLRLDHLPGYYPSPVVSHQDTLGVSKSWNELHNVLCQEVNGVVIPVRRTVSLSIAPHVNGHHMIVLTELRKLVTP